MTYMHVLLSKTFPPSFYSLEIKRPGMLAFEIGSNSKKDDPNLSRQIQMYKKVIYRRSNKPALSNIRTIE